MRKTQRQGVTTAHNNGMLVQGGRPPFSQIAKVFCGNACVSVHLNPVSTPSLRSVGHSLQAHGTPAQYKLATSTYLNVVCNKLAQGKNQNTKSKNVRHKNQISYTLLTRHMVKLIFMHKRRIIYANHIRFA